MTTEPKDDRPDRLLTDESLRRERGKTDDALSDEQATADREADQIIERARDNADAILVVAREKADESAAQTGTDVDGPGTEIARERRAADDLLRDERASEDARIVIQRAEHARLLKRLLPLEREKTDRHLLTERHRSDHSIANRDDFLGMVCHDLRNLLSGIVVDSFQLLENATDAAAGEDPEESMTVRAVALRTQRYAARMNRLVGDLVDVGSIDSGRMAMQPARGDFAAVVTEVMDSFQNVAAAKAISLEVTRLDAPLVADFDHDRMLQVLANLVANAIKFTANHGTIRARCEAVGGSISFALSDDGIGIPNAMLESIFERFWQVGQNDRRGLGLGLFISRNIVEAHGGTIWAESTLGKGSRLCFEIPLVGPAA